MTIQLSKSSTCTSSFVVKREKLTMDINKNNSSYRLRLNKLHYISLSLLIVRALMCILIPFELVLNLVERKNGVLHLSQDVFQLNRDDRSWNGRENWYIRRKHATFGGRTD